MVLEELFLQMVNRGLNAGWLILAVIVLRLIFRKSPKWIFCVLWGLVALRLICPVRIQSSISLLPSGQVLPADIIKTAKPQIQSGIELVDAAVNPILTQSLAPSPMASANPTQIWSFLLAHLWLIGAGVLLCYALISYLLLRWRLAEATLLETESESVQRTSDRHRTRIKQSDRIRTPFVLGFFRPTIYLPYRVSGEDMVYVIAHEQAHIAWGDHWWKLLGYLILAVYWFQPLVWVAYLLFGRDVEAACDEKVVGRLEQDGRRAYSTALLNCSIRGHRALPCPLAFGETDVKQRIRNILKYRKPTVWILGLTLVLGVIAAVCFMTEPREQQIPEAYWTIEQGGYTVALVDREAEAEKGKEAEAALEVCVYGKGKKWNLRSFAYDSALVTGREAAAYILGEPIEDVLGYEGFRILYHYAPGSVSEPVFCEIDYYTVSEEPVHLAQSWGLSGIAEEETYHVDLNGDGQTELLCNAAWADGAQDILIYRAENGKVYQGFGTDVMAAAIGRVPSYGGSRYLPDGGRLRGWYWEEKTQKSIEQEYEIFIDQIPMWEFE